MGGELDVSAQDEWAPPNFTFRNSRASGTAAAETNISVQNISIKASNDACAWTLLTNPGDGLLLALPN